MCTEHAESPLTIGKPLTVEFININCNWNVKKCTLWENNVLALHCFLQCCLIYCTPKLLFEWFINASRRLINHLTVRVLESDAATLHFSHVWKRFGYNLVAAYLPRLFIGEKGELLVLALEVRFILVHAVEHSHVQVIHITTYCRTWRRCSQQLSYNMDTKLLWLIWELGQLHNVYCTRSRSRCCRDSEPCRKTVL